MVALVGTIATGSIVGIPLTLILAGTAFLSARETTTADENGLVVRTFLGRTRRLDWSDVDGLAMTGSTLLAVTNEGEPVPLAGVNVRSLRRARRDERLARDRCRPECTLPGLDVHGGELSSLSRADRNCSVVSGVGVLCSRGDSACRARAIASGTKDAASFATLRGIRAFEPPRPDVVLD